MKIFWIFKNRKPKANGQITRGIWANNNNWWTKTPKDFWLDWDYFHDDQTYVWVQNFRKDDNFNQQQVALNKQESYKDLANNTKTPKQLPPALLNNIFFRDLKRADAQDRMKTRTGTTTIDKFGPTRALRMDLLSSTTLHSFTVCTFSNGGAVTGQYVLTAILPFLLKLQPRDYNYLIITQLRQQIMKHYMILLYETFVKWFESCADENAITGYIIPHIVTSWKHIRINNQGTVERKW